MHQRISPDSTFTSAALHASFHLSHAPPTQMFNLPTYLLPTQQRTSSTASALTLKRPRTIFITPRYVNRTSRTNTELQRQHTTSEISSCYLHYTDTKNTNPNTTAERQNFFHDLTGLTKSSEPSPRNRTTPLTSPIPPNSSTPSTRLN